VGSGSGYIAAAMAKLVGPSGHVLGVDRFNALVERANRAVAASSPELVNHLTCSAPRSYTTPSNGTRPWLEVKHVNVLEGMVQCTL
jgi:tRNA A58 N-methylase Trm61